MTRHRLQNENCAVLRRTSDPGSAQGHKTQERTVEQTVKQYNMRVVKKIDLKGVTGSMPGNRTDIDDIISYHKLNDNFCYLLLPAADRFTRAGSMHGISLLWDLLKEGIVVHFVRENLFSDDERDRVYLGFLFDAARAAVMATGRASTEGNMYSILDGRSPYTRRPPFGLDRLYTVEKERMHILRNLRDGRQEMWSPEANHKRRRLIRTFKANVKRGTPNHYRKQKNENVALVKGDPKALALVSTIMKMIWVDEIGERAATRILNDEARKHPDMCAPRAAKWYTGTVFEIAHRPIYTGLGIRLRKKGGMYVNGTKTGQAVASGVEVKELATRKNVRQQARPRNQWLEKPYPAFKNLLPKSVRDAAHKGIGEYLHAIAPGKKLKNKQGTRPNGRLLTGILRSKQGNERMCGGGGKKPFEYYVTSSSRSAPSSDPIPGLVVPGRVLDNAVKEIVADVIVRRDDLGQAMNRAIKHVLKERKESQIDEDDREHQLRALRAQHLRVNRQTTGDDDDDKDLNAELDELEAQIQALLTRPGRQPIRPGVRPEAKAEKYVEEFVEMRGAIEEMDKPTLRAIVHGLVTRMVVDLETRIVDVDLALPEWMPAVLFGHSKGTLLSYFDLKTKQSRDGEFRVKLASYRLTYKENPGRFTWERRKVA